MAVGAFAGDVPVGEEGVCLFVVVLLAFFLHELSFFVEFAEEVGSGFSVNLGGGSSVIVKGNAKFAE